MSDFLDIIPQYVIYLSQNLGVNNKYIYDHAVISHIS
jgi:hypothetical protein